jgi:hypothetical protein
MTGFIFSAGRAFCWGKRWDERIRYPKKEKNLRRPKGSHRLLPTLVCLLAVFVFGCASEEQFAGLYEAEEAGSPSEAQTFLELKEDGAGVWRVGDDEVSFSWYLKGGELRFNTKDGGVIVGEIRGNTIKVALPGDRHMSFKKSQ